MAWSLRPRGDFFTASKAFVQRTYGVPTALSQCSCGVPSLVVSSLCKNRPLGVSITQRTRAALTALQKTALRGHIVCTAIYFARREIAQLRCF